MALTPFIYDDWEELLSHALPNQNYFITDLRPKRMSSPARVGYANMMSRRSHDLDQLEDQLRNQLRDQLTTRYYKNSYSASPVNKDDFHVMLDVQNFKPEEIEVKIVNDHLVITAKHEEKRDEHGWVSRQFVRRYQLPKDVNVEHLTCKLCSDGLLTIAAPKTLRDETERTLRIEFTGKPFVNKKQEKSETLQQSEEEKPE